MAIDQNGEGRKMYRCHHRGKGCKQPRRTNEGLLRAAVLGLRLIGTDEQLKEAIRQELERAREPAPAGGGSARTSLHAVDQLEGQRRKLLRLYYDDRIGADLFAEEEARLSLAIAVAQGESEAARLEVAKADDVSRRFEEVARVLEELDIDRAWAAATQSERRILIEELVESVTVLPDHLEVTVSGAPRLHVRYQEVGLKESGPDRVGGGTPTRFGGLQPSPLDRVQSRTSYLCCAESLDRPHIENSVSM
jgi:hypothetical protein